MATEIDKAELVRQLAEKFSELRTVMQREGEINWIRGIESILARLQEADTTVENAEDALKSVERSWQLMRGGMGSFTDWSIWLEDWKEQARVNKEFAELKSKIHHLIECIYPNKP